MKPICGLSYNVIICMVITFLNGGITEDYRKWFDYVFASWLGWDSAVIKAQWTLKSEKCGGLEGNELRRLFLLLFCNVSLRSNSSSQVFPLALKRALCGGRALKLLSLFFLQVSIKWMVERSSADEALKEAPQGRAAWGRPALRRFTSQFADKTPLKQKKKKKPLGRHLQLI